MNDGTMKCYDVTKLTHIKQKKSGYHSSENRYLTHKTVFEVFTIDGMVAK